ncbi:hypothetical protein [Wenjunlia tyrosinilytica]|uniref:Uncharacterized protein n=1 Tax=Wenjunlia tyrosinilytica TaxID=1544741 RepID=A0A918E2E3_9ACTN|nr:hypothetical protein [Wenjunlia tyrosinilytica]GGO99108.1 hypothetical protein GCM10012280_64820 [Wenjunlia tyrosinilytica]
MPPVPPRAARTDTQKINKDVAAIVARAAHAAAPCLGLTPHVLLRRLIQDTTREEVTKDSLRGLELGLSRKEAAGQAAVNLIRRTTTALRRADDFTEGSVIGQRRRVPGRLEYDLCLFGIWHRYVLHAPTAVHPTGLLRVHRFGPEDTGEQPQYDVRLFTPASTGTYERMARNIVALT